MTSIGFVREQPLDDQLVEDLATRFGCVEQARIDLFAEHLAQLLETATHRLIEGLTRDPLPFNLGDTVVVGQKLVISRDAEEHEGRENQQQQDDQQDPLVLPDGVEHGAHMKTADRPRPAANLNPGGPTDPQGLAANTSVSSA